MTEPVPGPDAKPGPARRGPTRWHAALQGTADPLFVLDRRRRLVFVNRAWEELAGLVAGQVLGLVCRRPRPAAAADPPDEVLAHALTPPPEVFQGRIARARRLLPGQSPARR